MFYQPSCDSIHRHDHSSAPLEESVPIIVLIVRCLAAKGSVGAEEFVWVQMFWGLVPGYPYLVCPKNISFGLA